MYANITANEERAVNMTNNLCPCGSEQTYRRCCRPFHKGTAAPTPEALMRSRYSAFVRGLTSYLRDSWHHSTRPPDLTLTDNPQWLKLEVLAATVDGHTGTVHFKAHYQEGGVLGVLEERSNFVHERGRWYYVDGKIL